MKHCPRSARDVALARGRLDLARLLERLRWRKIEGLPHRRECKMNNTSATNGKRSIWLRGVLMILMAIAFHICGTLLALGAIIQFVLALLSNTPNAHLIAFARSLGLYLSQIADFVSFGTEEVPFPFSEWPSSRGG